MTDDSGLYMAGLAIGLVLIFTCGVYWFNTTPEGCDLLANIDCELIFDNHGLETSFYWIVWFVVMEIVFVLFMVTCKRSKKDDLDSYVVYYKFIAALVSFGGLFFGVPIMIGIKYIAVGIWDALTFKVLMAILGVVWYIVKVVLVVAVVYFANRLIAKSVSKVKKPRKKKKVKRRGKKK
jgi:hypothetical protein